MTHETLAALLLNLSSERNGTVQLPICGNEITVVCETDFDEWGDLVQEFSWWITPTKDSGYPKSPVYRSVFPAEDKWCKKAVNALTSSIMNACGIEE